ncbi:MAG: nuclear transport factor 2 family protein [Vicinamibacterales bacterium]
MADNPIERYFEALAREDYLAARACLADDFRFRGWFGSFDSADAYLEAMQRLRGFVTRVELRKAFGDGPDVCLLYTSHTRAGDAVPVAAWFRLASGRIASLEVICDSKPFEALWATDGTGHR